jgi:hypothetical protein
MAANMVLLEKITVGAAGASSVTFSGIPQTGYTDLVLKMSVRTDRASTDDLLNFNFNGLSSNQSSRNLQGNGSAASSGTYGSNLYLAWVDAASNTASTFGNAEMYIPNYTSSNYKSVSTDGVLENNASTAVMGMTTGLWSSTAAITSIAITSVFSSNFVQYSTFYLYGVAKLGTTPAIVPYATGGDTIMTDGTYWYHTFVSSGTFTPQKSISCDYLVVAGGGGGEGNNNGDSYGSGGGAGGLRSTVTATGGGGSLETALSLGTSAYTVTVGAGGVGTVNDTTTSGSNSVFSTITSTGGARGTRFSNGATGGSGSGAGSAYLGVGHTGGAGTANQGFAGGNSPGTIQDANAASGGGGGAGVVGSNGTNGAGGNGGNGVATVISGSSVTYAGGGGGASRTTQGTGGTGGGGAGAKGTASISVATAGTANTGGGGGGAGRDSTLGYNCTGGNGGSGLVIVRYAV